jgi:cytochrome c oxidase subunit 1
MPRIRSESPAFDMHHPAIAALDELTNRPDKSVTVAPGDKQK